MTPVIQVMWDADVDQALGFPAYKTPGAAGADLKANLPGRADVVLQPGATRRAARAQRHVLPVGSSSRPASSYFQFALLLTPSHSLLLYLLFHSRFS